MIPVRYICTGDITKAKGYIGLGRKLLGDLKTFASFNSLEAIKTGPFYFNGKRLRIDCSISYGISEVWIHYRTGQELLEDKKKSLPVLTELKKDCLCFPHFSMAVIRKVYPETLSKTARYKYDIGICTGSYYLLLEGAYDANFGRYSVGQVVLATIGKEMDSWDSPLDCDRKCLVDKPRFTTIVISPIAVTGLMSEWRFFS